MSTERILANRGEEYLKLQLALDKLALTSWVRDLAPWEVISHLTFRWEVSLDAARRGYERFMRKALPHLSYFYAEEANPSRDGYHVHALWADCRALYRKEAWATWFERFGRARIEPVRNKGDVVDYCSKYVTKEACWWNVKLQWHRSQALRGEPFGLERADCLPSILSQLPVPQSEFGFAPQVFNLAADQADQAGESESRPKAEWRIREDGVWEIVSSEHSSSGQLSSTEQVNSTGHLFS